MSTQPGLLSHDLLVLQQFRTGISPEFDIENGDGHTIGRVVGTENGARRFFMGPREFDVLDTDGSRLTHISDVHDFWRDTYQVTRGDGSSLATVAKKMAFFSRRFAITLTSGEEFMVASNFLDREYDVVDANSGGAVAHVSREYAGFAKAFLGHDRYALHYPQGTSPDWRLAILGGMVALDLMRAKDSRSSDTSND